MNDISIRRLTDNEAVFRQLNEYIHRGKKADNNSVQKQNNLQEFICECSDELCDKRIKLRLRDFEEIHKVRNRFVIAPGHEVPEIESMLLTQAGYSIVEKIYQPSENPLSLHKTDVQNT
jgi:hypothetical protein